MKEGETEPLGSPLDPDPDPGHHATDPRQLSALGILAKRQYLCLQYIFGITNAHDCTEKPVQ